MRSLLTLCLCLVAAVASAATPAIVGPNEVAEHKLARLHLEGLPDGGSAVWECFPFEADGVETDGGQSYAFTAPPGTYYVSATYLQDGKLGRVRYVVTIGAPKPVDPVKPDDPVKPVPGGFDDLAAAVKTLAKDLPAELRTKAAAVYGEYGGKATSYASSAELSAAAGKALEEAVGTDGYVAMRPFRVGLATELTRIQKDGRIPDTAAYGRALKAVSQGLQ